MRVVTFGWRQTFAKLLRVYDMIWYDVISCNLRKKKRVVWDLSLEMFDNGLLVWIEFKFVLNYC